MIKILNLKYDFIDIHIKVNFTDESLLNKSLNNFVKALNKTDNWKLINVANYFDTEPYYLSIYGIKAINFITEVKDLTKVKQRKIILEKGKIN